MIRTTQRGRDESKGGPLDNTWGEIREATRGTLRRLRPITPESSFTELAGVRPRHPPKAKGQRRRARRARRGGVGHSRRVSRQREIVRFVLPVGMLTRAAARRTARTARTARQPSEVGVLKDPPLSVGGSVLLGGVPVPPPTLSRAKGVLKNTQP
jgi:hypothetical protein